MVTVLTTATSGYGHTREKNVPSKEDKKVNQRVVATRHTHNDARRSMTQKNQQELHGQWCPMDHRAEASTSSSKVGQEQSDKCVPGQVDINELGGSKNTTNLVEEKQLQQKLPHAVFEAVVKTRFGRRG